MTRLCFIEISDEPIIPGRTWTDPRTGLIKPIPAAQTAYVWTGAQYPECRIEVQVPDTGPYRPGRYLLAGGSLRTSQRKETKGDLQFNRFGVELMSFEDAAAVLAAKPSNKIAAVG